MKYTLSESSEIFGFFKLQNIHTVRGAWISTCMKNMQYKLGLSWAKLSYQLGFGCTGINIFCLSLINMKLLHLVLL